jgi:hypothetical protein
LVALGENEGKYTVLFGLEAGQEFVEVTRPALQFGLQISQSVLLDPAVDINETELAHIFDQPIAFLLQLGNSVLAHRPLNFSQSQAEALLFTFDGIHADVFETLLEGIGKRRGAGLDERSKIRLRVLPYVPRAFNQSGIADERAGLIGGRFLIIERSTEVALPHGNLIGPITMMKRLAQFVNRQLFDG